jgi:hypothetical protein
MRYMGLGCKSSMRHTFRPLSAREVVRWYSVISIMAMEGRTYRPWDMLLETSVRGEGTILIMHPVCPLCSCA